MGSMDPTIISFTVRDVRWPTSLDNIGTDPMNLAGENAFGYLQYRTDVGLIGTGWSFTIGQGNEYDPHNPTKVFIQLMKKRLMYSYSISGATFRWKEAERFDLQHGHYTAETGLRSNSIHVPRARGASACNMCCIECNLGSLGEGGAQATLEAGFRFLA
jgi:hypothetical protein